MNELPCDEVGRLAEENEQYRQVAEDGRRLPDATLSQGPAFLAFKLERLEAENNFYKTAADAANAVLSRPEFCRVLAENTAKMGGETNTQKFTSVEDELQAILATIPDEYRVSVQEGGGPENLFASLAVSVNKLVQARNELRETIRGRGLLLDETNKRAEAAEAKAKELEQEMSRLRNSLFVALQSYPGN